MKRTAINRRNPKHRAANDRAARERAQYLMDRTVCFICLLEVHAMNTARRRPNDATEIHHIAGRDAKRCELFEVPANWCPICRGHHRMVTDEAVQTAQLVWDARLFCDPATACLETLRRLNPRRFRSVA